MQAARHLLLLLTLCFANSAAGADSTSPNVLLIMTDDQGWGDLSLHRNQNLQTPNLDALARNGASFENFYVCPVCSPTRCEALTGRYHRFCGVTDVTRGGERINLDERLIGEAFQASGYRTALFGKWHSGTQHPYHPNDRGFDEFYGFTSGHWGHYFAPQLDHNGQLVQGQGYLTDDFTDKAIQYAKADDAPFFIKLAYCTPHSPMQVPDRWWNEFKDRELLSRATNANREDVQHTRAALAMVENIDWNIGRLVDALRNMQKLDNTIILFMTDNGPNGHRFNDGMLGTKGQVDEGGVRSPLFVHWPRRVKEGTQIKQLAAAIDLAPTLIDLCGMNKKAKELGFDSIDKPFDGISLAKHLTVNENLVLDRTVWTTWNNKHSIRNQRFRYVDEGKLYDIEADRSQVNNVAAQYPVVTATLAEQIAALKKSISTESSPRAFTIGFKAGAKDQLPARDADLSEGLQRTSKHPNCSYITHWTSTADTIRWQVDALNDGDYEVEIFYACNEADLDALLTLSTSANDEAKLRFQRKIANPSPWLGANEDRVMRVESYWKDMLGEKVGVLRLSKGTQTLTLSTESIAGGEVGELGMITLNRLK